MSTSAKTRKTREAWEKTSYGWRTLVGQVGVALIYAYVNHPTAKAGGFQGQDYAG